MLSLLFTSSIDGEPTSLALWMFDSLCWSMAVVLVVGPVVVVVVMGGTCCSGAGSGGGDGWDML